MLKSRSLAAAALACAIWSGCVRDGGGVSATAPASAGPTLDSAMAVQARHTPELMRDSAVVGTAVGYGADSVVAMFILTRNDSALSRLPASLEGIGVIGRNVGEVLPYGIAAGPATPRDRQDFPVRMGTSGGWKYDANAYGCCGGTLGSLVTDGKKKYILSNWHVLQSDQTPGLNSRVSQAGDSVIQPALADAACDPAIPRGVARITGAPSLPLANVDAAIAEVAAGRVDETGYILNVGVPSRSTLKAKAGLAVKKMGRTTGLTRSRVTMLNATIAVPYPRECGGPVAFTKVFTGQILVDNPGGAFLGPGDSGSLLLEDADARPRAVGLLYAGSRSFAVANPIDEVLKRYGMSMVGQ